MAVRSALVTVMVRAAQKAGRGLVRDFGEVENLQVSRKGPADFVSAADMKSDQTLRDELKRARPRFGIETEESGVADGEDGGAGVEGEHLAGPGAVPLREDQQRPVTLE